MVGMAKAGGMPVHRSQPGGGALACASDKEMPEMPVVLIPPGEAGWEGAGHLHQAG